MHAHAHLGVVGFFTILTVGVSYKLIPMFMLSEVQSQSRAKGSVILLAVGLAGAFVTILFGSPFKLAFAVMSIAGLAVYGWELVAILRARKRLALDWGIKYFITALGLLAPLSLLGLVLSWPGLPLTGLTGQLENLYGFLGLLGLLTFAIMGMLYKILPFLIWLKLYGPQIGKAKVPALAEMFSVRLQLAGYWIFLAGLVAGSAGILLTNEQAARVGCGLLALGVLSLVLNVVGMLSHFLKPRLEPFAIPAAPAWKPL